MRLWLEGLLKAVLPRCEELAKLSQPQRCRRGLLHDREMYANIQLLRPVPSKMLHDVSTLDGFAVIEIKVSRAECGQSGILCGFIAVEAEEEEEGTPSEDSPIPILDLPPVPGTTLKPLVAYLVHHHHGAQSSGEEKPIPEPLQHDKDFLKDVLSAWDAAFVSKVALRTEGGRQDMRP